MSLINELKRRNVFRVAAAYVVVAWIIIQVAETIFPLFGFDDAPARLVVIVLAIGFVPVVVFAWAFELTPEGLKKEGDVDRSVSVTPQTGKRLDRIIMIALALGLGYFAVDKFVLDPRRDDALQQQQAEALAEAAEEARREGRIEALVGSYGDKSVAVMPFVNISSDQEQEYFSDGISEELLNLLARTPELRVISRSSSFSYKGKDMKAADIARELNVAHILEGSVRSAGNTVRITAQLIEAQSDTYLWSETFDRNLDNVFAIQDEIAATVVEKLRITLLGDVPRVHETDPRAYALFLQARQLGQRGSLDSIEQSILILRQVLEIDPEYAPALVELARAYIGNAAVGALTVDEGRRLVLDATNAALAIDPDYALAHVTLGMVAVGIDNDLQAAADHLEYALQLEPANLEGLRMAANLMELLNRTDEVIALNEFVIARDPVNPLSHNSLGLASLWAGRWDDAIESFRTALRLSPDVIGPHNYIGLALLRKGEVSLALDEFAQESDDEYRTKGRAMALYSLGRQEEFEVAVAELIEGWGEVWPSEVAHVYAWIGDADSAFAWLDKAVAQEEDGLNEQRGHPALFSLHEDTRWATFLRAAGTAPEQIAAIRFEVSLPD